MNSNKLLQDILIKQFYFSNGKWFGESELVFYTNNERFLGSSSFTYDRTWHILNFNYPFNLKQEAREQFKQEFHDRFDTLKKELHTLFISPREKHTPRPVIEKITFHQKEKATEFITATFKIKGILDEFTILIQLKNSEWTYKLQSKKHSLDTYKSMYAWEDVVFKEVIRKIENEPKIRVRFIVYPVKLKYK